MLTLIAVSCYYAFIMKKEIHPKYYTNATIKCACGAEITAGSTKESTHVEICSACHPFFTGNKKIIDTTGRVERFQVKRTKAAAAKAKK